MGSFKNSAMSFRLFLLLSCTIAFTDAKKACKTDKANLKIFPCNKLHLKFGDKNIAQTGKKAADMIHKKGYTKCVLPFGVLVAGYGKFNDAGILTTAKLVAELIDQDQD